MEIAKSILLVDDDAPLARSISEGLRLLGFEVSWVSDRAQAVATLCANHTFDAVLLDLDLDGDRGEDVVAEVRATGGGLPR